MNNIQKHLFLITLPRQVLWLFIALNIAAILFYPGSTYRDNLISGYSFTQNFLKPAHRKIRIHARTRTQTHTHTHTHIK